MRHRSLPPGPRIAIVCSGLGRVARGFERFFHELGSALRDAVDARVYAGRLPADLPGHSVPCVPRSTLERLGMASARAYYWEQLTFAAGLAPFLVAFRPHVIHLSDPALANALLRLRRALPGRPALLYCNGAPLSPAHYRRYDHVQLVAPWQLEEARASGIDGSRVTLLPHGVDTGRFRNLPASDVARSTLRLPGGLLIVTVAALSATHKRVDYLIRELANPSTSEWILVCVGQRTAETPELERLAAQVAPGRVLFRTAAPEEVPLYLAAADLFALASTNEGFGLAAVEAMAASLPVVLRDVPSLRYVVGDDAQLGALDGEGDLLPFLEEARSEDLRRARGVRNRERVTRLFDWHSLLPAYLELYRRVAAARVDDPPRPRSVTGSSLT